MGASCGVPGPFARVNSMLPMQGVIPSTLPAGRHLKLRRRSGRAPKRVFDLQNPHAVASSADLEVREQSATRRGQAPNIRFSRQARGERPGVAPPLIGPGIA